MSWECWRSPAGGVRRHGALSRAASGARRGALLLEAMLALAIFIMAGTAILTLIGGTMDGMERMKLSRQAADLATSAMAKMEAGIETPQTLNGPVKPWRAEGGEETDVVSGWELHIESEPTQFRGLTKLTVRAFKRGAGEQELASYTLRQLVRLSGKGEDRVGGEDALAAEAKRGLPTAGSGPSGGTRKGGGKP